MGIGEIWSQLGSLMASIMFVYAMYEQFFPYQEKRFLTLTFHELYRDLITGSYIQHVLKEGRAIIVQNRTLKLYTNNPSDDWYGYKRAKWSHVNFEHPSTFETLAMDPKKKEEIVNDLVKFKTGKEYYAKDEDEKQFIKNLMMKGEEEKEKKAKEEAEKKAKEDEEARLKAENEKEQLAKEEEVKANEKSGEVKENSTIH
ncbi:ATP-dependent zinc metalloprotease FtsH [Spatholobus suberectus]|nr:ATP-dependent zinc metalloprotease FtsH [Spatholobus suberectus]